MSKAFTREDDDTIEEPVLPPLVSPLPPGAKNYMTPEGVQRLRKELAQMLDEQRPPLVPAAVTDPEAKRQLAQLDQRIRYLQHSLTTAEIVPPAGASPDQVTFGSTVTVRDDKGVTSVYRIVGVDEADFERNEVSWLSPIARALINARLGQKVPFKFPRGASELEVVKIG